MTKANFLALAKAEEFSHRPHLASYDQAVVLPNRAYTHLIVIHSLRSRSASAAYRQLKKYVRWWEEGRKARKETLHVS